MIYGVTESNRFLYHYTRRRSADLILENRQLRMTPYEQTNDPRENKAWRFWLTGATEQELLQHSVGDVSREFSRALKKLVRVTCFCTDSESLSGDPIRDISKRGLAKPRMWQQYGEEHKGVCFVLDRESFAEQMKIQFDGLCGAYSGKMTYIDRMFVPDFDRREFGIDVSYLDRVGLVPHVTRHAHTFRQPLFFEKMTDWQQENEFRWIVLSREDKDVFVDISQSLVGVVFGEKLEPIEPMLKKLSSKVRTVRLGWINGCPWYDFTDIRCDHSVRLLEGLYSIG
jgi:DUF2971 family protein